jgi:hypothetical protein
MEKQNLTIWQKLSKTSNGWGKIVPYYYKKNRIKI